MVRMVSAVLALSMLLTACSSGDDGPLVVYSGRSEDLVAPLIEQFETESGVEVDVRYADSTELAATLLAEGDATDADVFFAQDPASLGSVSEMMAVLPDDIRSMVPERFTDDDGRWVGTSGRIRVLIYDRDEVPSDELPSTVGDLIDERWAGSIGVAPTNGSFLAFVAGMILAEGEDATLTWLEDLAALDPVDFTGNSPIVAAADSGQVEVGLVNHYYVYRLRAEGAGDRADNHFFAPGDPGSLVMPAGAGVLAQSARNADAEAFVEFLLSASAQEYFATETFEYPLVPGSTPPAGLPALDSIEGPDIDLSDLAQALDRATDLVTEAGLI